MQIVGKTNNHIAKHYTPPTKRHHIKWLFFILIWPFGALIGALKNYKLNTSRWVFWLFCIYFGLVFIVAEDKVGAADSARYASQLDHFHKQSGSLSNLIQTIYNPIDGFVDVYQPLATWLVAIFSDDPHWLFALFALVFGYFYSKNIWIVLNFSTSRISVYTGLVVLAFALLNPIWNINGVRMWTAAQVFVFGAFQYLLFDRKLKGLFWMALTILIHFSFSFPIALLFVWLLLPSNVLLYFVFFIATAFVSEINLITLRNALSFLPDIFQPRITGYTQLQYAEQLSNSAKELSWHVTFSAIAGRIFLYIWVVTLFLQLKRWEDIQHQMKRLFMLALFLGGWANLASLVPSGGRFLTLSTSLFFSLIAILLLKDIKFSHSNMSKLLTLFFLLFFILFQIRTGFDYMGFLTFLGNPLLALVIEHQTPLIEFIKSIF